MSNRVYDSGELDGLTENNPLTVNHNYGKIPSVYAVYRVVSGTETGWEADAALAQAGVYVESCDANQAVIKCREEYSFEGKPKLVFFD